MARPVYCVKLKLFKPRLLSLLALVYLVILYLDLTVYVTLELIITQIVIHAEIYHQTRLEILVITQDGHAVLLSTSTHIGIAVMLALHYVLSVPMPMYVLHAKLSLILL